MGSKYKYIYGNSAYNDANISYTINGETGELEINSIAFDPANFTLEGEMNVSWPWNSETNDKTLEELIGEIKSFPQGDIIFIQVKKDATDYHFNTIYNTLESDNINHKYDFVVFREDQITDVFNLAELIEKQKESLNEIITPKSFTIKIGADDVTTDMEEAIHKENKKRKRIEYDVEKLRQILRKSGRLRDGR
jgi:hypothetical protein